MDLLRRGSQGPYVEMLQLGLRRAGYYVGAIDGIFGIQTENAVRNFQRNEGLSSDGIAGRLTFDKLSPYLKGYLNYTVQRGDSVYKLAQRYQTTQRAIITANNLANPESINVGQRLIIPYGFALVPTDINYSYALTEYIIEGLRARYPFITIGEIGKSVMGKSLYSLEIGNGDREVFYNGAHHANEWITTPILLKFIERYADAVSMGVNIGGVSASTLFDRTRLYLVPLVNPDGMDLVTGALDSGEYYERARELSENYPGIPFPSGWKANIDGIDTNLSYPAGWERAREIKFQQGYTLPGPRDFVGDAPLSAVESRAVYDFTLSKNFLLTLSYHTQGEVIYWKYLDYLPERSFEIGQVFSNVSGYLLEDTPYASGFAGYKDWFIMQYNRPGYTIEAGFGENPLPISEFSEIYADNLGILVQGLLLA